MTDTQRVRIDKKVVEKVIQFEMSLWELELARNGATAKTSPIRSDGKLIERFIKRKLEE